MNPNLRWCPKPQCNQTVVVFGETDPSYQRHLVCTECGTNFCADCNEVWHGEISCQQAQTQRVKPCPSCFCGVVKITACNHIICHCGYEFCWICEKECDDNHYRVWNILQGCPGSKYHRHPIYYFCCSWIRKTN